MSVCTWLGSSGGKSEGLRTGLASAIQQGADHGEMMNGVIDHVETFAFDGRSERDWLHSGGGECGDADGCGRGAREVGSTEGGLEGADALECIGKRAFAGFSTMAGFVINQGRRLSKVTNVIENVTDVAPDGGAVTGIEGGIEIDGFAGAAEQVCQYGQVAVQGVQQKWQRSVGVCRSG
jgi:hypothetical protein